jgi:hypothetical protein
MSKKKNRRIEDFNIEFGSDGLAVGWFFDVPLSFRSALDIERSALVDKAATKKNGVQTYRYPWTRGVPPILSFSTGDVFYAPAGARAMVWRDALDVLKFSITVIDVTDREITFILYHYVDGVIVQEEEVTQDIVDFELILRNGFTARR